MRKQKGQRSTFKENNISSTHTEKYVVYTIRFIDSKSIYVGSTVRKAHKRWWDHTSQLRTNIHANSHLQNAFNKYHEESMEFEIIEICNKNNLLEREQYWIDFHNTFKKGFNKCPKAANSLGTKRTQEQKDRIRDLGNWKKANVAWRGESHTEETKKLIRQKRKLQIIHPYSDQRKAAQSKLFKEKYKEGDIKPSYGNRKYGVICVEKDGVIKEFDNTTEVAKFLNSRCTNISYVLKHNKKTFKGYKIYLKTSDQVKPSEFRENPEVDNPELSLPEMVEKCND